ncbi:hypothetical protein PC9H_000271 [Pleurotus ostreatus]|uniref:Zn(2)-C6 fungal-type domain-containing protein n=1 Tax=Pleurotus ostreatus TaxID=5322 RepID=A0A8H7A3V0_PLEOS|nr:uncharacterized protein PC9H_000271 [Pleurotus ostreatus]KAF7439934.1 hypothetical protein PC9H_000271 [Pleurotus ostreatus]
MPQTSKKTGTNVQKAHDKESKRARGAMSCAECRRLKLKCDKTVPCSSCRRRGCESICPNGSLITGQGTRFVLADTEKLHQKIGQMSDRIRQLEDALFVLQSSLTSETHPLLTRDLLQIKSSIDLHSAVDSQDGTVEQEDIDESQYIDSFGTLAIRDDGAATFYGRSAGSEDEEASPPPEIAPQSMRNTPTWQNALPSSIAELSSSFPFAGNSSGVNLEQMVDEFLPQWGDAWRLCEFYLEQAPWFFGAVTKRQVHEEILPLWYSEAACMAPNTSFPPHNQPHMQNAGQFAAASVPIPKGTAHDLALLFVIFCFGALTDNELPPAPDNPIAHQYFQLTRAALSMEPVIDRPPSVATVQVLSLMAIYEGLCSGENSIERTWALMGLATKLAQSIGLHKDCARFKLSPSEVQKRRALFWELFITDCWQSLATGRLPSFSLPFVDCELPSDPDQTMAADGSIQPSFPFWKARFGAECVSAVVQGTLTSRAPKYSIILQLDRKIRDMTLPKYSLEPPPQGLGLSQTMQHFMPINYRELTLLYVHRCFFAHAVSSHPSDPLKSPYAPSFLAGYRSACELISSLAMQFSMFPAQIARFWVLWTHAFSSSVMLSSVVIHCTKNKVAAAAIIELKKAHELFEKASHYGGRAVKFLPIIQRLWLKAQKIYQDAHNGIHHPGSNDIFTLSSGQKPDELSIFGGKTHSIVTKVTSPQTTSQSPASSSRPNSTSAHESITSNPAFSGMHPSLAEQMHSFESHIQAQIRDAQHVVQDDTVPAPLHQHQYSHPSHPPPQHPHQHPPPHQHQPEPQPQHQHQQHQQHQYEHQHQHQHQPTAVREAQPPPGQFAYSSQANPPPAPPQHRLYHNQYQPGPVVETHPLPAMSRLPQPRGTQSSYQHPESQTSTHAHHVHPSHPHPSHTRPVPRPAPASAPIHNPPPAISPSQIYHQHEHHHYHHPRHVSYEEQTLPPPPPYEQEDVNQLHAPQTTYDANRLQHAIRSEYHEPAPALASASTVTYQHTAPPVTAHYYQPQAQPQAQPQPQPQPEAQPYHPPEEEHRNTYYNQQTDYHAQPANPHSQPQAQAVSDGYTYATRQEPETRQTNYSHSTDYGAEATAYPSPQSVGDPQAQPPSAVSEHWPVNPAVQQYYGHPDHTTAQNAYASQHYTPVAALQGIAADDNSLQETWLSYMNQVGSPRNLFDD